VKAYVHPEGMVQTVVVHYEVGDCAMVSQRVVSASHGHGVQVGGLPVIHQIWWIVIWLSHRGPGMFVSVPCSGGTLRSGLQIVVLWTRERQ